MHSQQEITRLVVEHFEHAHSSRGLECEEEKVWGVSEYPSMFDEEANFPLYKVVSGD